jgi:hypothetical protein
MIGDFFVILHCGSQRAAVQMNTFDYIQGEMPAVVNYAFKENWKSTQ